MKLNSYLTRNKQIGLKSLKWVNIRPEIEKNIEKKLLYIDLGHSVLFVCFNLAPKTQKNKSKN